MEVLSEPRHTVFTEGILNSRFFLKSTPVLSVQKYQLQFPRLAKFYLKHLYTKTMETVDEQKLTHLFLAVLHKMIQFVILNKLLHLSCKCLIFCYSDGCKTNPNQWVVIKLFVKKELIRDLLQLMLVILDIIFKNEVLNQF